MSGEVFQLTFVATRREGVDVAPESDRKRRLDQTIAMVGPLGLTGVLVIRDLRLLYMLEGPQDVVLKFQQVIKGDPRIQGVVDLKSRAGQRRLCQKWHIIHEMAHDGRKPPSIVDQLETLTARMPADVVQTLMGFAKLASPSRAA